MFLQQMIGAFLNFCQAKKLQPKTMESYEQTLKLLSRWLEEEKNILTVNAITEEHRMNISELARVCGLSRPTVYKYLKMVK